MFVPLKHGSANMFGCQGMRFPSSFGFPTSIKLHQKRGIPYRSELLHAAQLRMDVQP